MNKYTQSKFKSSKHYINKESKLKRILPYAFILVFSLSICAVVYIGIANAISYHIVPPQVASGGETNMGKTALTIPEQIKKIALENDFDENVLLDLSFCESSHRPLVRGDNGHARGLFQIHDTYHPEVSDACAFDIQCSAEWTIWRIKSGYGNEWTCWSKL